MLERVHPLAVEELTKRYGRTTAVDGLSFAVPGGQRVRVPRPERRGQDDDAADPVRPRPADVRARARARPDRRRARPRRVPSRPRPRAPSSRWPPRAPGAATPTRRSSAPASRRSPTAASARARTGRAGGSRSPRRCSPSRTILLLDEPATGLDPHALRALRARLREHAAAGGTVLLSSHVLEEVAATCDRVVVVNRGRRVAEGGLDDLLAQRIRLRSPEPDPLLARAARARPRRQPGRPRNRDRHRRRPRHRRPRRPRQRRRPARDEHAGRARGALRRPHGGVVRIELAALRSVPALRRALALAIAFSGFLAISFLGVRDLDSDDRDRRAQRALLRRRRGVRGRRLRRGDGGRGGGARRARARAARRRRPPPRDARPARARTRRRARCSASAAR